MVVIQIQPRNKRENKENSFSYYTRKIGVKVEKLLDWLVLIFASRQRHNRTNAGCKGCNVLSRHRLEVLLEMHRSKAFLSALADKAASMRRTKNNLLEHPSAAKRITNESWNISCDHFQWSSATSSTALLFMNHQVSFSYRFSHKFSFPLLPPSWIIFLLRKKSKRLRRQIFHGAWLSFHPVHIETEGEKPFSSFFQLNLSRKADKSSLLKLYVWRCLGS